MTVTACRFCRHFDQPDCQDAFNCFEPIGQDETPPETFKTRPKRIIEQTTLLTVRPDYSRIKREWPEQQPIADLPLFNLESQQAEQLSLFN